VLKESSTTYWELKEEPDVAIFTEIIVNRGVSSIVDKCGD